MVHSLRGIYQVVHIMVQVCMNIQAMHVKKMHIVYRVCLFLVHLLKYAEDAHIECKQHGEL